MHIRRSKREPGRICQGTNIDTPKNESNEKIILTPGAIPAKLGKMKAKKISLDSLFYYVDAESIGAVKPASITKLDNGKIRIKFQSNYRNDVIARPDDEQIENYYLNFDDARKEQIECRGKVIRNAYTEMIQSIERYHNAIEKYYNKPLTSDSEVDIFRF